jgi:hypothetical protein
MKARPKPVEPDETLSPVEANTVRRGEAQLKRGESKPWRVVKQALATSRFSKESKDTYRSLPVATR